METYFTWSRNNFGILLRHLGISFEFVLLMIYERENAIELYTNNINLRN